MGAASAVPTSGHMQQAAVHNAPNTSPSHKPQGTVQPIGQLTGMEQPLDKLSSGK